MGFRWGHMQKYHDSPPWKWYLLSCWGKTKKGFKLLFSSNNLKWMLLYLCKKLWPVLAPFYLCAHAPGMQLSPTWWHHVGMSKIVVQAMWWLGYLVPEMCIKNIMPIASQHVEPDNTKWEKIIQSNTNWEEIIQSVQRVCQRFDMLSRFLSREFKETGPISGLPVM